MLKKAPLIPLLWVIEASHNNHHFSVQFFGEIQVNTEPCGFKPAMARQTGFQVPGFFMVINSKNGRRAGGARRPAVVSIPTGAGH